MKTLYAVYREAIKTLADCGVDSPEFSAQQLVEYCFGFNKTQLLMNSGTAVDEIKLLHFNDCVKRRCRKEPLQYIIGMWDFYRFTFKVGDGVLIPRPETEMLVDFAVEKIRKNGYSVVLDLCCGSGCVGLSIAKMCPRTKVYCVDISDTALEYTRKNKELLDAQNVTVIKSDVLESTGFVGIPRPDIIVTNPPYIPTEQIKTLQKEVTFEPTLALDGGADGLTFYRSLSEIWYPFINRGGFLAMECGEEQASDIVSMFVDKAEKGKVMKDAAGHDRVVVIAR